MINPPTYDFIKGSHCSYCGSRFAEQIVWPRQCFRCNNESYANPLPVVVAMIIVWEDDLLPCDSGLLIQQRNIEPQKGQWAFPSGYVNLGETWQEGLAREVKEEMGLLTKPEDYECIDVFMGNSNNTVCIFARHLTGVKLEDINFVSNNEVSDMSIAYSPKELAFPSHTLALKKVWE